MRLRHCVCVLLLLLAMAPQSPAQAPVAEPTAVRATIEVIDRIRAAAGTWQTEELAKVGGATGSAPSDYNRIVIAAKQQVATQLDELLQRTADPAAKVEVFLAFLHYPDQRAPRESLQDALVVAPAGRCRARVQYELAELVVTEEPERALVLLERAAAEDPTWAAPVLRRAWVGAWAGRHAQAVVDLDEAARREPAARADLQLVRARFLLLAGEFDRAVEVARACRTAPAAALATVEQATLLEAAALLSIDSKPEAAIVLRPHLAKVDAHGSLFDFQDDALKLRLRRLVEELEQANARAAAPRRQQQNERGQRPAGETIGIDRESDEERGAREAEEMRVAELARAKARALREAARPKPAFVDVPCTTCRGGGAAVLRCPHCVGRGTELYRTRKYTEREQQGANWVVRTREVPLPCHVCDGHGVVGGTCSTCRGTGVVAERNPNR